MTNKRKLDLEGDQQVLISMLLEDGAGGEPLKVTIRAGRGAVGVEIDGLGCCGDGSGERGEVFWLGLWEGQAELIVSPDIRTDEVITIKLDDASRALHPDDDTESPWLEVMRLVDKVNPRRTERTD